MENFFFVVGGLDPFKWMEIAFSQHPAIQILTMMGITFGVGLYGQALKAFGKGSDDITDRTAKIAKVGILATIFWSTVKAMFGG